MDSTQNVTVLQHLTLIYIQYFEGRENDVPFMLYPRWLPTQEALLLLL